MMIERGYPPDFIFSLDMLSFIALVEGSNRINAAKKIEQAWTAMTAAQGTGKSMKNFLKPFHRIVNGLSPDIPTQDEAAFKARFGKGF